jgi:hypothetical protein
MFKFVIITVVLLLFGFLLAEPAMQVGKRIANRFKGIAEDLDGDSDV